MIKALKELTKDTLTYGVANIIGQVISFFLLPVYTSYLSPRDYGIVAMLSFIGLFFVPLAGLGISNAIFRRFNLHDEVEMRTNVLSTGSIFVLFSSLGLLLVGLSIAPILTKLLVNDEELVYLLRISLYGGFFSSIAMVLTVVLRAQRKVRLIATLKIGQLLVSISCSIYFVVFLEWGIAGLLYGNLIGIIFSAISQFIFSRDLIRLVFKVNELKALLAYGVPFLPHRLITISSLFLGQYLMKSMAGLSETGLFSIAVKFVLPLTFIVNAVQTAWTPIKFQIHKQEEEPKIVFRKLISFYFMVLLPLFLICITILPEVIRFLTPAEYHEASKLLPLVLLIPLSQGVYFMSVTGFEFTNNTKPMPLISGTGILVLLISAFTLFEFFEIEGIIIAIVLSWLSMSVVARRLAIKRFFVPTNFRLIGIVFGNAVALSIGTYFLQDLEFTTRVVIELLLLVSNFALVYFMLSNAADLKDLKQLKYLPFKKFSAIFVNLKRKIG